MAKDPSERYPSAGDLGQAALAAAGGLRRASPWSGPRHRRGGSRRRRAGRARRSTPRPEHRRARESGPGRLESLRWAIALAGLLIVAVGMVAALNGISTL